MNVINAADESRSLFNRITTPFMNICQMATNLTNAGVVLTEIINEGAILTKDIALYSLEDQKNELLARRAALRIA
jgi:hypothetical protein